MLAASVVNALCEEPIGVSSFVAAARHTDSSGSPARATRIRGGVALFAATAARTLGATSVASEENGG